MAKRQKRAEGDLAAWEPTGTGGRLASAAGWKPGDPIGYIRSEIPEFAVPAYAGTRYAALVPDTLDLQERAALAVHALTEPTDALADHEMYFFVYLHANPPMMQHSADSVCQPKFMEALPLLRIASGSRQNEHVDGRWMEMALHDLGPDGLAYMPAVGRPWALYGLEKLLPERAWQAQQILSPIYFGRLLSALTLYYQRDGGPVWKEAAERLVDGMARLAVDRGSFAYFAPHVFWAERGNSDDPARFGTHYAIETRFPLFGLAHLVRATGYEPALGLAGKLIHYMLDERGGFEKDGRFNGGLPGFPGARHFHAHTSALHAILEYALLAGDAERLELVRRGFAYGKANGNLLLGYFPEWVNSPRFEHSELCEVADMLALAVKLSLAGAGDYWDDADRWARNMFAEGQLLRTDWIGRIHTAGMEETRESDVPPSHVDAVYQTTERVAERNLGAFAGWPTANDWYAGQGMGIEGCCTGNAARALYYLWDGILGHEAGRLRVNLLLNRASPWADVDSHIPYIGQVDVRVKQPLQLSIRIPEWVEPQQTRCHVNGEARGVSFAGRYAQVGAVGAGDVATLTFPIAERTDVVYIEKERYTLVRKGNEVVSIDPPGKYCPLYQRAHYRVADTRWRKIERFVSDERIHW